MVIRTGVTSDTPDRIIIDAGAVYLNYGLGNQRLLGATRGGNEFNLNRVGKNIEVDGPKGPVRGMERVTEVGPQITANLIELSVENLIAAIAGADQSDRGYIELEHIDVDDTDPAEFDLDQNDVIENSERVYVKQPGHATVKTLVLQTRSKKYASRFAGAKAANNKEFETGIGDWINAAGKGILEIVANGQVGNCLKFTGEAASTTTFLTLPGGDGAVLTNLVEDEYYRLQIAIKIETGKWTGPGTVTVNCSNGATAAIVPTTDWEVFVIVFKATGTDATITLVATDAEPGASNEIKIDNLELERVDYPTTDELALGQVGYVMNWGDNINAKASVIFMSPLHATDDEVVLSYTYELAAPGTHTTITGGEIVDADYLENVAIVGNVSGTTNPVICIVKNAIANTGFSLATAPRDEAVPAIVFTGHYLPGDLDTEPWEIRWPNL